MASLERQTRGGNFRIIFRYDGRRLSRTLKTSDRTEAESVRHRFEENLRLLDRGRLTIPADADAITFLLSDGRLGQKAKVEPPLTLKELVEKYKSNLPGGALEPNTIYTIEIHMEHFLRVFRPTFSIRTLSLGDLQNYIDRRSSESGRRTKKVSPVTIKKELTTLRGIWKWGIRHGQVGHPFPAEGLKFPKTTEKSHFQTFAEIESLIERGGLTQQEQEELWDCLFLTVPEMKQVLAHVQIQAHHPHLFPMVVFAALTGARRSELVRSHVSDLDFRSKTVVIHERKRIRGQQTTRRVPLTTENVRVIESWLRNHPGGPWLFCRKRVGSEPGGCQLTVKEVAHEIKAVLANSKWAGIRGWHVFRHSFASNCAARGTDQRMIDRWMGHQTEEMRKRYSHLIPTQQLEAINAVFG